MPRALTNGGFESGTTPWVQTSTNGYQLIDTTRPHTGTYSAYLGGYNNGADTIYQQITIPCQCHLGHVLLLVVHDHPGNGTTRTTYMYAQVLNSSGGLLGTLQTTQPRQHEEPWTKSTFDLLAYKGQTIRLYFKATTDVSLPTTSSWTT